MTETALVMMHGDRQPAPVTSPLEFTPEQQRMIRSMVSADVTESEFAVLVEIAKLKRLNPLTGQCHFVSRNAKDERGNWVKKWSVQTGIDGFRAKAEEHPMYDGQSDRQWSTTPDGKIISCKVSVFRKDRAHPFTQELFLEEYIQLTREGSPTAMWKKPRIMLGKCAEAAALRMAFPDQLGGLYTNDEVPPEADRAPPQTRVVREGYDQSVEIVAPVAPEKPNATTGKRGPGATGKGTGDTPFATEAEWRDESPEHVAALEEQRCKDAVFTTGSMRGQHMEAASLEYLQKAREHMQSVVDGGRKTMPNLMAISAMTYWIDRKSIPTPAAESVAEVADAQ